MTTKGEDGKGSKELGYNEDRDQLEEKQEEETGELKGGNNNKSSFLNLSIGHLQHIIIIIKNQSVREIHPAAYSRLISLNLGLYL
ncbi:hypothetical protein BH18THE2_BH18THE2_41100 [soil metagenome]